MSQNRRAESQVVPEKRRIDGTRGRGRPRQLACGSRRRRPCHGPRRDQVRLRYALQPHRHRFHQVGRPHQHRPHRQGPHRRRHGHRGHRLPRRAGDHPGAQRTDETRALGLHGHPQGLQRRHRRLEQAALRRRHRSGDDGHHHRRSSRTDRRAARVLASRQQGAADDADLQRVLQRPAQHRHHRGRKRDEGRQRPLHVRLRRLRAPHQPRDQHVHPLQPAEPDGQLLDAGGADAHRRDLPSSSRHRPRRRDPLRLRQQGPEVPRRSPACRTRPSSTTASRSRRRASRSASRR